MDRYKRHLKLFAILVVAMEVSIMFIYGFYVRHQTN